MVCIYWIWCVSLLITQRLTVFAQLQVMPILPVNDAGAVVYYEDSGIHNGSSDYTTIVMIHGFMFTSGTSAPS